MWEGKHLSRCFISKDDINTAKIVSLLLTINKSYTFMKVYYITGKSLYKEAIHF